MRYAMGLGIVLILQVCSSLFNSHAAFAGDLNQVDLREWNRRFQMLHTTLMQVKERAEQIGVPASELNGYLLEVQRKLLPQLGLPPMLVVSVMGGTNLGKSAITNYLVGRRVSEVSSQAARTSQVVATLNSKLVPSGLSPNGFLNQVFPEFIVTPWTNASDAVAVTGESRLIYQLDSSIPTELIVADTPDFDSIAVDNWERAKKIGYASDVIIAVITSQKHKDEDVIQAFRKAAESNKPVIVVVNQVELDDDLKHWPIWIGDFLAKTGIKPVRVLVSPRIPGGRDNPNIHESLQFYEVGLDGKKAPAKIDFRREISELQIRRLQLQARAGSTRRALLGDQGAQTYLNQVSIRSLEYAHTLKNLEKGEGAGAEIEWPLLPGNLIYQQAWQWWEHHQNPAASYLHGIVNIPTRLIGVFNGSRANAEKALWKPYLDEETIAMRAYVDTALLKLESLKKGGGALSSLVTSITKNKTAIFNSLDRIRQDPKELPNISAAYHHFMTTQLNAWQEKHPGIFMGLQALDTMGAVARSTLVVGSFLYSAWIGSGALAGGAVGVSADKMVTYGAGSITGPLLQWATVVASEYQKQRVEWLHKWLYDNYLKPVVDELTSGGSIANSEDFKSAKSCMEWLVEKI